jgi:hypothetical protein
MFWQHCNESPGYAYLLLLEHAKGVESPTFQELYDEFAPQSQGELGVIVPAFGLGVDLLR